MAEFSRAKFLGALVLLFLCGALAGISITNFGHATKAKRVAGTNVEAQQPKREGTIGEVVAGLADKVRAKDADNQEMDEILTACQSIEKVLVNKLEHEDGCCSCVKRDLEIYQRLSKYGCKENLDKYFQEIENKNAILSVVCTGREDGVIADDVRPCEQIEQNLFVTKHLDENWVEMSAEDRIDRAKTYAIMAERGCPENTQKYTDMARKELEIARGISDDKLDEKDTIEVVETYKRLKMQQDAEEVFKKVKKMTNPAIDFIIQVEKIINE